jgi:hypothetical protein
MLKLVVIVGGLTFFFILAYLWLGRMIRLGRNQKIHDGARTTRKADRRRTERILEQFGIQGEVYDILHNAWKKAGSPADRKIRLVADKESCGVEVCGGDLARIFSIWVDLRRYKKEQIWVININGDLMCLRALGPDGKFSVDECKFWLKNALIPELFSSQS